MAMKGTRKAGEEALKKRARDWKAWRDSAVTLWVAADTLWQASKRPEPLPDPLPSDLSEAFAAISPTTASLGTQAPTSRPATENLDCGAPFGNLRIPALMLYGMAMENYLKALMVEADPEFLQKAPGNSSAWRGHKLKTMAKDASKAHPQVAAFDPAMLEKFSNAITWYGRYPGPLDKHLATAVEPSGEAAIAPRFTDSINDRKDAIRYLEELKKIVGAE
ncbi:MAG TPA: hypothetical protein PK668_25570 [Myxococcota bacterium]|nr:hypothetical protein [Myxococcota bacterium]HRY96898.1 hypothetical protein [Myxococcota bacterium]